MLLAWELILVLCLLKPGSDTPTTFLQALTVLFLGRTGKYAAKQAVQEELEKSGLGYMFVTSYCLTSCWVPGLGNMGQPCPPEDVVPIIGDGSAKGMSYSYLQPSLLNEWMTHVNWCVGYEHKQDYTLVT
jgi:hypothetical protein